MGAALRRTRLFADAPPEATERLVRVSTLNTYRDGERIVSHGDPGFGLMVIADGCVVTSRTNAEGKRLIFDLAQPGQVMGSFAAFDGQPSPLDNHARGDTRLVVMPYDAFVAAVRAFPDLAISLIAMHTRRNRVDFERMMTALDPMRVRVAKVLLYLSRGPDFAQGPIDLPVRMSQDDIAGILGVTRSSVNKELVSLAERGIITWHYSHVVVNDVTALASIAYDGAALSDDLARAIFARSHDLYRTTD